MPCGFGALPFAGTDAISFTVAGLPAMNLIAINTKRLDKTYHTRLDLPEHLELEVLEAAANTALEFIREWDKRPDLPAHWWAPKRPPLFMR